MYSPGGVRRVALVAWCGLVGLPAAAWGQRPADVEAKEAPFVGRIHELAPLYLEAKALADAADAREIARLNGDGRRQDTVLVGPLRIVTTSDQVEEAGLLWLLEWSA